MLQLSLYNENHEFVQLNELKTQFLKDSYCERPCINLFVILSVANFSHLSVLCNYLISMLIITDTSKGQ